MGKSIVLLELNFDEIIYRLFDLRRQMIKQIPPEVWNVMLDELCGDIINAGSVHRNEGLVHWLYTVLMQYKYVKKVLTQTFIFKLRNISTEPLSVLNSMLSRILNMFFSTARPRSI